MRKSLILLAGATFAVGTALAGCGGDDDTAGDVPDPEALADDPEGAVDDIADNLEDTQDQQGGGSATLTIGDMVYEFSNVLCAFGTDGTQSEDWDFSLSSIQDGTQLSVTSGAEGGPYGDVIDYDDIENFDDPSVKWSAPPAPGPPTAEQPIPEQIDDFIKIDGKQVSAEIGFIDGTVDVYTGDSVPGMLTATCP